jgi:mRNA-degrading endonuclease RelE of RelBE toxin-antitoxin system
MKFSVLSIPPFDRQLKRLAKKYPSLKAEFAALLDTLETAPEQGTAIGNNCFKIRLSIASKGKGKRGGGRIITNVVVTETVVYLLTILRQI